MAEYRNTDGKAITERKQILVRCLDHAESLFETSFVQPARSRIGIVKENTKLVARHFSARCRHLALWRAKIATAFEMRVRTSGRRLIGVGLVIQTTISDLAKFVLFSGASSALLGSMRFSVSTAALLLPL